MVPLIEILSYLKSQETKEFTNTVIKKQGKEQKKIVMIFMFHMMIFISSFFIQMIRKTVDD